MKYCLFNWIFIELTLFLIWLLESIRILDFLLKADFLNLYLVRIRSFRFLFIQGQYFSETLDLGHWCMFSYGQGEQIRPIGDNVIYIIWICYQLLPAYSSNSSQECRNIEMFHFSCCDHFMAFFYCSIKFTDAVHQKMTNHGNFMHSWGNDVSGTCCSNIINHGWGC